MLSLVSHSPRSQAAAFVYLLHVSEGNFILEKGLKVTKLLNPNNPMQRYARRRIQQRREAARDFHVAFRVHLRRGPRGGLRLLVDRRKSHAFAWPPEQPTERIWGCVYPRVCAVAAATSQS